MFLRSMCLCLVGAWTCSTACAQSPLDSVPNDVALVARLAGVDTLETKVSAFAEQVEEGLGEDAAYGIHQMFFEIVQTGDLDGVDLEGDWFMLMFANGTAPPDLVMMIPATDGELVLENIANTGVTRDGYVLASPTNSDVEALLNASEADSVTTEIPNIEDFMSADYAVFINADLLVETYANEIEAGRAEINRNLDQLEQIQLPNAQMEIGVVVDLYRSMLDWFDDVLADAEAVTVTLNFGETDVVADARLVYREGSESAESLSAGGDLAAALSSLPEGMPIYIAAPGTSIGSMLEWSMRITSAASGSGIEEDEVDEIVGTLAEMEFGSLSAGMSLPYDGMPFRVVSVLEVDDVEGYRELTRQMNATVADFEVEGFHQTTTVEEDAEEYGELSADVVTVNQEFEGPAAAMQNQINDFMFGEDGIVTRIVYNEGAVLTSVGGREVMEATIEAYESGESPVGKSSEGALEDATFLALIDLPAVMQQFVHTMVEASNGQIPIPREFLSAVEEMELETSFITISASTDENAVLGRISVPAAQVSPIVIFGRGAPGVPDQE